MEILYIYIQELNAIKNLNLNFGGKYRFEYNANSRELIVTENPKYIEGFFEVYENPPAKVTNVTSLIGENGTGKSSILKYLLENFPAGFDGVKDSMILAIAHESNYIVYYFDDLPIKRDNLNDFSNIAKQKIYPSATTINNVRSRIHTENNPFENTDFIYFSNLFDGDDLIEVKGIRNISTNFLIRNDFKNDVENHISVPLYTNQIDNHIFNDIERQINFIKNFHKKDIIPFKLPDYISIKTKRDFLNYDLAYTLNDKKALKEYGWEDNFIELLSRLNKLLEIQTDEKAYFYILSTCLLNFLLEIATWYKHDSFISILTLKIDYYENINRAHDLCLNVLEGLELQLKNLEITSSELEEKFVQVKSLIEFIYSIRNNENVIFSNDNQIAFYIKNKDQTDFFFNFFSKYKSTIMLKPYLNFGWRNLSTGEKALLNIYSRFFSLTYAINILEKNVIVLIDEGDIFLHPSWQKEYLFLLLKFLPEIYSTTEHGITRNIQIILTTHSPIPASDLPNSNTIFLEKVNGQTIVKDSLESQKETFASNIHTILSDSFFMKNGFTGEFAKHKLDAVISDLNTTKPLSKDRKIEIKKILTLIGEPIIKRKLMEMFDFKFNLDVDDRLSKIEENLGL